MRYSSRHHVIDKVILTKGTKDTLTYIVDGEQMEVTGEFHVDEDGILHHVHLFNDGEEIDVTLPYDEYDEYDE